MKLPKRVSLATAVMLIIVGWTVGWMFHDFWSTTIHIVFGQYYWVWQYILISMVVLIYGMFFYIVWKGRKLKEKPKEASNK